MPAGFISPDIIEKEVVVQKAVKLEEEKEVDPEEAARIRFEQMREELQNVDLGEEDEEANIESKAKAEEEEEKTVGQNM